MRAAPEPGRSVASPLVPVGVLCGLMAAGTAAAHGPAPSALAPLSADADGPRAVLTSIGLATRWGDGYRYLGPSRWRTREEIPFAAALPDGALVVAASAGLFRADPRGCEFADVTPAGWGAHTVFDAAPGSDAAHVFTRGDGASVTFTVRGDGPVEARPWPGEALDSGLADARGTLWIAAARPSPHVLSADGVRAGVADPADFLDLRLLWPPAAPRFAYVVTAMGPRSRLVEVNLDENRSTVILTSMDPIHGPILRGEQWLVAVGSALLAGSPGGGEAPVRIADARSADRVCLHEVGGEAIACELRDLTDLRGAPWFQLSAIRGPDPECGGDELNERDWIHFGAEAGLLRLDGGASDAAAADAGGVDGSGDGASGGDAQSAPSDEGGCKATALGTGPPFLGFLVWGVGRRSGRRAPPRERPSRDPPPPDSGCGRPRSRAMR